ncbi:MAG: B12-binding domain-containing protein [Anaerolineales bacterium]|nr:B12-binding domain-containing protein [Anaerolineales bacterium]
MTKQEISKTPRYNLNVILRETGIKADTLRVWEKRYHLPVPARTKGGHRLFSEYDLETVRWLISRQQEGMRISQAVDYWRGLMDANQDPFLIFPSIGESPELVLPFESGGKALENLQASWLDQVLDYNEPNSEQILSQAFALFPLETVCLDLILPGLAQIGEGWYEGQISVHQEHFASELVSKKLQTLISTAPQPDHSQRILIGCPAGEFHTIPGSILNLLLRFRGWDVIYLGANIPTSQFKAIIKTAQPDLILLTASRLASSAALLKTARYLQEKDIPLGFGGWIFNQLPDLSPQIPGTYLGPDLNRAVPIIEDLIQGRYNKSLVVAQKEDYQDLVIQFKARYPLLKDYIFKNYSEMSFSISSQEALNEGIEFLYNGILAAFTLGDIAYLSYDFLWIGKLLRNRNYQGDLFQGFIETVMDAIREYTDDSFTPILEWLAQQMNNNHGQVTK